MIFLYLFASSFISFGIHFPQWLNLGNGLISATSTPADFLGFYISAFPYDKLH